MVSDELFSSELHEGTRNHRVQVHVILVEDQVACFGDSVAVLRLSLCRFVFVVLVCAFCRLGVFSSFGFCGVFFLVNLFARACFFAFGVGFEFTSEFGVFAVLVSGSSSVENALIDFFDGTVHIKEELIVVSGSETGGFFIFFDVPDKDVMLFSLFYFFKAILQEDFIWVTGNDNII